MNPIERLAELIEDWRFLIRRDGLISTMPLVTKEIAQLPYRHLMFWIFARSLDEPLPVLPPKLPIEIRSFKETDLKLIKEVNRPSEARLCAQRLERRHYGLIAMNQLQVAGYAWGCAEIDPQMEQFPLRLNRR